MTGAGSGFSAGDKVRHTNTKRTAIVQTVRVIEGDHDELFVQPLFHLFGIDTNCPTPPKTWWSALHVEHVDG